MKTTCKYFVGDFETTVFDGQTHTEVWASASAELFTDCVNVFHSIGEQFEYFKSLNTNVIVFYHNLKFDGNFWLAYLMNDLQLQQATYKTGNGELDIAFLDNYKMPSNTFKYSISDKGQWYSIVIKIGTHYIEMRDSLKLLPFSVRKIGESFGTKHQKLEMEYKGFRYAGCDITDSEMEYIKNDVLVMKEAMEIMFSEGHDKITIGACCLHEFKKTVDKKDYTIFFPNLYEKEISEKDHKYKNAGDWIRKSYKGGWCYVVKEKVGKIFNNGTTADVNSLYPSMMHSESGNRYPIGIPKFWKGDFIPPEALIKDRYFFVRVKTRFYLKENYLPFIQIKGNYLYKGTEALESSDVLIDGKYYTHYTDDFGIVHDTKVELTMTMTDYYLFLEHYEPVEFEIIDGCWFYTEIGLFDEYINYYREIKTNSKGAKRELAKLFLNNLYGKMASSMDSSFKYAFVKEDKSIGFRSIEEHKKNPGYIPIGSAITSYARNFTIRAAQKNYHGVHERGFIYADTDSIHCDLLPSEIVGINIHDTDFCCWKLESFWDVGVFTRQKTYIEHVTMESVKGVLTKMEDIKDKNRKPKSPYHNVKCAGMPQKCKDLFLLSMKGAKEEEKENYNEEEQKFLYDENGKPIIRTLEDFKVGLKVCGKLMPVRIHGGVVLMETMYEMR